jgi:hypothetical protein
MEEGMRESYWLHIFASTEGSDDMWHEGDLLVTSGHEPKEAIQILYPSYDVMTHVEKLEEIAGRKE